MMGSPYTVNYTLTAYTNDLVNPLWPHAEMDGGTTGNMTNTGWQPALRVFDRLSTTGAGGSVWTGLNAGFYKIGSFTMLSGNPPSGLYIVRISGERQMVGLRWVKL
jgi:hypothetical protein